MKLMMKLSLAIALLLLVPLASAQANFIPPTVYVSNATTGIAWTAGTVNNGGHPLAVTAGSSTVTLNQTSCASPTFAACNFVYANNAGTVAVTTTLATAVAAGNTLLALIETGAVTTTQIVYPWQSGTMWLQAGGPISTGLTSVTPSAAGTVDVGSAALPWRSIFLGTAATNNQQIVPVATGAARTIKLADQGANGAMAVGDQTDPTKVILWDSHLATAGTTLTISDALTASRIITYTDPGGAANIAYANPTTAQAITNTSHIDSSTANPSGTGIVRLGNADLVSWRNAANSADISLSVNASNNLVLTGGTAPTDGYYFVGPENCSMALTTGTFAANPATSGGLSAPAMVRAASGNTVLQLTTTAAANTTDVVCDITPPSRITSGKGITITAVDYLFGYQTTALSSIGTAVVNTVTYPAAGGAAAGTVANIGGALTVTAGTSHGTPGATTTSGQCYHEKLAFGTPYAVVTDNTRIDWQNTFVQAAASATVMQICGSIVYYSNINSL